MAESKDNPEIKEEENKKEPKPRKQRTKEQISYTMSRIRGKDTTPELVLRHELYKRGIRYEKNSSKVFGHPDIVFIGKKVAVFIDGTFWHGYEYEEEKNEFKTENKQYWFDKIERNMERDKEVTEYLEDYGWKVLRYWDKDVLNDTEKIADEIEDILKPRTVVRKDVT